MRRGRRMFWNVYLHGVLLLAVVAVALGVVGFFFGRPPAWRAYAEHLGEQLAARSDEIAGDSRALQRDLSRDREWLGLEVSVYDAEGRLKLSTAHPPVPPLDAAEMARLGPEPIHVAKHGLRLAVPVVEHGHRTGYAVLRHGRIAPHLLHGALVLSLILALLAIGSVPLARAIASPLERLTLAAERLGEGDLSARAGIRRGGEVGNLARAFDEMAERLQSLVRGEKELLANVSHELRTPLARIRVALETAEESAKESDGVRARASLGEIATDLGELERLVDDVLTAARLDLASGQAGSAATPLRRGPVDAGELVGQVASRFRARHPERRLDVALEEGLPALDADAALLRRALDNLLDNARKYSADDAPIALAARSDAGSFVVEVRDRGIGIEAADLPRLFTPFFRTDRSRARGTGGVGLGLALARRIAEAHGGTIAVESRPDEGTTVRFTVPGVTA